MAHHQEQLAKLTAVAHVIRWMLELGMIWGLVFPETGPWTAITLTMIAIGIEVNYINGERIKSALIQLADQMVTICDPTRKS